MSAIQKSLYERLGGVSAIATGSMIYRSGDDGPAPK